MATTAPHQQPTPERFFNAINAYEQTEAMKAAVELEIFTAIDEGNTTAATIAKRCDAAERGVRTLCDFRKLIAYERLGSSGQYELWMLPLGGDRKPYPYLVSQFHVSQPAFSVDGNWLAYTSNESGRAEVYVQRFPGPGEKIQVSTDGGNHPVWSHDGKQLVYENAG